MITKLAFKNFKALRNTTLPLGRFTLLVGANGSGKSTALQALEAINGPRRFDFRALASVNLRDTSPSSPGLRVEVDATFSHDRVEAVLEVSWPPQGGAFGTWKEGGKQLTQELQEFFQREQAGIRVYALDPRVLHTEVSLQRKMTLGRVGENLAGVLDRLRDEAPERWEALNQELGRVVPEFDRILFETPNAGTRTFLLRTRHGGYPIPASDVSQGTLLALAMLTLAHLSEPPPLIGLEEPDRGIHPRLLRDVRDVLYRLCYPKDFGEDRPPVQVVATTQSPYFLDLFKDHPEEIVIAQKEGSAARFTRLADHPNIAEILADAPLGDVWYSGILGGVPPNR
jgi:predicted ATPase